MGLRHTRLKFIWGASARINARWKLGLWGFYERKQGYPDSGLAVSLRGLVLWFGVFFPLLAYLGATTAIFFWLDRREHNHVTYADTLLLPLRWDEIQAKRGQSYLDEGMDDLKNQHWSAGVMKLRLGLARYPKALKPRQTLAEFYFFTQRQELAMKVLEEGMDATAIYPGNAYLTSYIGLASRAEDYATVLAVCDRYLDGKVELTEAERVWLTQQKMTALLQDDRPEEAFSLLKNAPENALYNEQRMLIMLEMKEPKKAVTFLNDWAKKDGSTEQILRLQVRAYRESADFEKMNEKLSELRKLHPADPRSLAYAVIQQKLAGLNEVAHASLEDYFFRFGGFLKNIDMIAQPLAEIGAVDMLQETIVRAQEQGYDIRTLLQLLTQAQLKSEAWSDAYATSLQLKKMDQKGLEESALNTQKFSELLALVAVNPAEGNQVLLMQQLEKRPYAYRVYRNIAETLLKAKRYEAVQEIVARAEQRYPRNHGLDRVKAQASEAIAAINAEKPDAPTVKERPLFVEDAFFGRMQTAMAEKNWKEAGAMIRTMQQSRPSWLKTREVDVLRLQMVVAHESRDVLEMSLAARMLLDGTLQRSMIVVDYAVELHRKGEADDAVKLLTEVSRKMPEHALARRYLEEWTKTDK